MIQGALKDGNSADVENPRTRVDRARDESVDTYRSAAWLNHKYHGQRLDCVQIGKLVNRDPKTIWAWLKRAGIQTRPRGAATHGKGFQYGNKIRVGRALTLTHKQQLRAARAKDGNVPALINGVHWTKALGRHGSQWRGGITPDRQAFYASVEWAEAVKAVWKRDDAFCQRCGLDHRTIDRREVSFHIHHIESFQNKKLRAVVSNLILVCSKCHRWIHSKANTKGLYLVRNADV